jgi:hypothetical protein
MRISVAAYHAEATLKCGHKVQPGDLAHSVFPVAGSMAFANLCEGCSERLLKALRKAARLPTKRRHDAVHRAGLAADANGHEAMKALVAWIDVIEAEA